MKPAAHFQKGYTLVELLVYIAILVLILFVAVSSVISISRSYTNAKVLADVDRAGALAMERLVREIRGATSIDVGSSVFGSSPGRLVLNTTTSDGSATTVDFFLNGGVLKLNEGGAYTGPLTSSSTSVTGFTLKSIDTGNSTAVKIDMTISETEGTISKEEQFHDTVILRGTYQ